ncbi:FMN-binding negative transcriptional regulator [Sphingomonas jatrophae]|uniref:Negative transcriptional regulator, PaiB family n=1 Tax=Sphingomonas jatrophae TaxID=1166337 RepID=A0A1I6JRC9_9SPHN|nr:FMN-binding negative transcriptional regulator [Sphingomonas jatrophae]SFR81468.1 negative transcriptional regulator, PaiB family [Sphingomonas jatrophae]
MSHPDPRFRMADDDAALALVERVGFAHLFVATADGPMVAHVPLARAGARAFRFHVARANRIHRHLAGARALASVVAADGYVTPSWYADPTDQVPTWNYVAVELEGVLAPLDAAAMLAQMDRLAATHEPLASDRPWTRSKLGADAERRLLRAIEGFELAVDDVRTTEKLSQNKSAVDRAAIREGAIAMNLPALAAAMEVVA